METSIERILTAPASVVFDLAARVEDWPRILPHYRAVNVLDDARTVEMSCVRPLVGSVGIPLRWQAVQTLQPPELIRFHHVRGPTRGMDVTWQLQPLGTEAVRVTIRHLFEPHWPAPDVLVHLVVGEFFINGVARRTLERIAELAEASCPPPAHPAR